MIAREIHLDLKSEAATNQLGEDLALTLKRGDLVRLCGDLGAGKSLLARAIIRAACDDDDLEVPSPTFTLVQNYESSGPCGTISHFDLYRLNAPEEVEELGLYDALDEGIALIEWPERAGKFLPENGLSITLEHKGPSARRAILSGSETMVERVERSLSIRSFLETNWHSGVTRRFLLGDASTRTYEVSSFNGCNRILMNSPPMTDGPIISDGKPYSQIAHLAEDVRPFFAIAKILRSKGFRVPEVYAHDLEQGFLLMENLGNEGLITEKGVPDSEKYLASVEALAHLHQCNWPRCIDLEDGSVHTIPSYDRTAMMIEVDLMPKWYAPRKKGYRPGQKELQRFEIIWHRLIDMLEDSEKSIVLRDYHSPNILWQGGNSGIDRIGMIDFQDAMIGPAAYDVASLAQDARITVSVALEQQLCEAYIHQRQEFDAGFDTVGFLRSYAIMAAQRATKVLGIFVRLDERDGKPGYLAHLPRIEAYLEHSLQHPDLAELKDWCKDNIGM